MEGHQFDEDNDEDMDEEVVDTEENMEYDESGSKELSQTQPDESADIEEALAGGKIQEPEDGWEDVDEDMDGEDDEDDEDDKDLHDDEGNENEIM